MHEYYSPEFTEFAESFKHDFLVSNTSLAIESRDGDLPDIRLPKGFVSLKMQIGSTAVEGFGLSGEEEIFSDSDVRISWDTAWNRADMPKDLTHCRLAIGPAGQKPVSLKSIFIPTAALPRLAELK